ncbi:MAG: hypothetical protein U0837_13595 [Dehalococcoidia bacterium]|jgi:hypothetical protein
MEYIDTDSPLRLGRVIEARQLPDLLPALEPGEGFQIEWWRHASPRLAISLATRFFLVCTPWRWSRCCTLGAP